MTWEFYWNIILVYQSAWMLEVSSRLTVASVIIPFSCSNDYMHHFSGNLISFVTVFLLYKWVLDGYFIFICEHTSVWTQGKSGSVTAVCMPAAHRTEKVEKPDETVCEPRQHSCQLAFSQPFALSSSCGKFLTDFLNFKFLLLQPSLYIQQNSLSGTRKKSLHRITRTQLTQGWATVGQLFWNLQFWYFVLLCTNTKAKYSNSVVTVVPPDPLVHFYHWWWPCELYINRQRASVQWC